MKKIIAVILFAFAFFIGCKDDSEEDVSIGTITITGIPAKILVNGSNPKDTYKVYLNASDSQSENDLPVAKGVAKTDPDRKQANGTYIVIINLQNPNPPGDKNPNLYTGPWSGTARYFAVVISPQTVHGVDTISAKAGFTLNKGKAVCNWDSLIDLRTAYPEKINALYRDIVSEDDEITVTP